jgi:hypothetical protein
MKADVQNMNETESEFQNLRAWKRGYNSAVWALYRENDRLRWQLRQQQNRTTLHWRQLLRVVGV